VHRSEHLNHPKYRKDIDGLRAISILSVVGFHAFPLTVKGGFIGVDIFFVISGYLISTIIFGSLEKSSFSFIEFYIRRIKRIFPALILVLIASFMFGWFVLFADEYKQLGKHIAGGAGFVSNFLFWGESGYFDNAAETKPLLHLWSLGVEEQFYIIWPLLLWFAWKPRWNLLAITLVVAVISFALSIAYVHRNPAAAFYSPQTRFWELMAGSILAYLTMHRQNQLAIIRSGFEKWVAEKVDPPGGSGKALNNIQSLIGILLIIIGAFFIDKAREFPGWWALLPTLGAVLIISASSQAWLNRVVLSNRVIVWIGLISYPLYLWHWPVLSFAHIIESDTLSNEIRVTAIVISVILAWLTYRLIERPIRFGKYSKEKTVILIVMMALVGYSGYNCYKREGLGFRFKERQEYADYFDRSKYGMIANLYENHRVECGFADFEKFIKTGQETPIPRKSINRECYKRNLAFSKAVFIWGDSHAQQLYSGLKKNLPSNWQILQVASFGCVADVTVKGPSATDQCTQNNWFAVKSIREAKPDVVIVAQNRGHNIESFRLIANQLMELGVKKVIFVGPTPHWTSDFPKIMIRKLWLFTPRRTYIGINKNVLFENAKLQQEFKQTDTEAYANLIDFFCNKNGCLTYLGEDRKAGLITWDRAHLTPVASDYLAKNLLANMIVGEAGNRNSPAQ